MSLFCWSAAIIDGQGAGANFFYLVSWGRDGVPAAENKSPHQQQQKTTERKHSYQTCHAAFCLSRSIKMPCKRGLWLPRICLHTKLFFTCCLATRCPPAENPTAATSANQEKHVSQEHTSPAQARGSHRPLLVPPDQSHCCLSGKNQTVGTAALWRPLVRRL